MVSEMQREFVVSYLFSAACVTADYLHPQTELQAPVYHTDYRQLSVMVVPGKKRRMYRRLVVDIITEHRQLANDLTVADLNGNYYNYSLLGWDNTVFC